MLRSLYDEDDAAVRMAGVAQAIAGLGTLFYVAVCIWKSLCRFTRTCRSYSTAPTFAIGLNHVNYERHHQFSDATDCSGTATMLEGQSNLICKYREKDRLE